MQTRKKPFSPEATVFKMSLLHYSSSIHDRQILNGFVPSVLEPAEQLVGPNMSVHLRAHAARFVVYQQVNMKRTVAELRTTLISHIKVKKKKNLPVVPEIIVIEEL